MQLDAYHLTSSVWILTGIYWAYASISLKPIARTESSVARAAHLLTMTIACFLLASPHATVGLLADRFVPETPWLRWAGFGLVLAGSGVAACARAFLGTNWSATVALKQDHDLIRRGPYAIVRHPMYAGFLIAVFGTSVEIGEVRALLAFAIAFLGFFIKARREEHFLRDHFDGEYTRYARSVKRLIPFVL